MRKCPKCQLSYGPGAEYCLQDGTPLLQNQEALLAGRTLHSYHLLEPIGRGAAAHVYKGQHVYLGDLVAVKVLMKHLPETSQSRFLREARAIRKINHPNVVQLRDFGRSDEGLSFLVMNWVDGQTLDLLLRKEKVLPTWRAARLVRQIAKGLASAHALGLIHRDLKPSNLIEDTKGVVKILDFGLVGDTGDVLGDEGRLTEPGRLIGTPRYMAPEQVIGDAATPKSDLYALGVVLFELLAGRVPFLSQDVTDTLAKHLDEAPPSLPPSDGLETIVERLLQKSPDARFASAEALVEAIDEAPIEYPEPALQKPKKDPGAITLTDPGDDRGDLTLIDEINDENAMTAGHFDSSGAGGRGFLPLALPIQDPLSDEHTEAAQPPVDPAASAMHAPTAEAFDEGSQTFASSELIPQGTIPPGTDDPTADIEDTLQSSNLPPIDPAGTAVERPRPIPVTLPRTPTNEEPGMRPSTGLINQETPPPAAPLMTGPVVSGRTPIAPGDLDSKDAPPEENPISRTSAQSTAPPTVQPENPKRAPSDISEPPMQHPNGLPRLAWYLIFGAVLLVILTVTVILSSPSS